MNAITNKNTLRIAYVVVFVMLFQLLSSTFTLVSAASHQNKSKSLLTLCTAQGYQQVWVDLESENNPDSAVTVVSCLYCLFNNIVLDAIDTKLDYYSNPADDVTDNFLDHQIGYYSKVLSKSLSIRAPPQYS